MSVWDQAPETEFHWWSPEHARELYRTRGVVRIPDFLAAPAAQALADRLIRQVEMQEPGWVRVDVPRRPVAAPDSDGGPYSSWLCSGPQLAHKCPELSGLYHAARLVSEAVCGRPVRLSPYENSAVTAKVYEPMDRQEGHRDSNPLAALLVLRGNGPMFGAVQPLTAEPGTLIVFAGRRLWHSVPPSHDWRVTVPFNLYHPEDVWRPAGQDERVYG